MDLPMKLYFVMVMLQSSQSRAASSFETTKEQHVRHKCTHRKFTRSGKNIQTTKKLMSTSMRCMASRGGASGKAVALVLRRRHRQAAAGSAAAAALGMQSMSTYAGARHGTMLRPAARRGASLRQTSHGMPQSGQSRCWKLLQAKLDTI